MTVFEGTKKPTGILLAKTSGAVSDSEFASVDAMDNIIMPFTFEIVPPENLIEFRSIWMYLDMTFRVGVAAEYRKIERVSIANATGGPGDDPTEEKFYSGGPWVADGARRIQITLNLSNLIVNGKRQVIRCFIPEEIPPLYYADLEIWRVDRLFLVNEGAK